MSEYKRITDDEVFKVLEDLKNEDEQALGNTMKAILLLQLDLRHFMRKVYKNMVKKPRSKTVTDPLKAKEGDVIIGNK